MKRNETIALFIGLFSEMLFGASFVFIKMVRDSISIFSLLAWRNIFGLIFMVFLIKAGVLKVDYRGKGLKPLLLLSLFQPVTYYIFETAGVRMTTASESGMLLACCPIITMCFAAAFLKDMPTRKQACFMVMTVAGGLLAAAVGGIRTSGNGFGYLFLLIAMCCEASYAILSQSIRSFNSAEKTFAMVSAGALVFTLLAAAEQIAVGNLKDFIFLPVHDKQFLIAVLFLSLGCNVIGFLCGNYVLPIIGATKRGACGGFGTVVAILGGVIILKESFLPLQMVATVLILAGAYGVLFSSRPEPAVEDRGEISKEREENI